MLMLTRVDVKMNVTTSDSPSRDQKLDYRRNEAGSESALLPRFSKTLFLFACFCAATSTFQQFQPRGLHAGSCPGSAPWQCDIISCSRCMTASHSWTALLLQLFCLQRCSADVLLTVVLFIFSSNTTDAAKLVFLCWFLTASFEALQSDFCIFANETCPQTAWKMFPYMAALGTGIMLIKRMKSHMCTPAILSYCILFT